jgi:hypothetical protein
MDLEIKNILKIKDIFLLSTIYSILAITFLSLPYGTGDTAELVNSSLSLKTCLMNGVLSGCAEMERFGFTPHLITLFLWSIFKDIASTISAWSLLNFILYSILIYYVYIKSDFNKFIKISVLISSPLIAYATYSFTEMTYIFMIFLLLISLKENKLFTSIVISILASSFKESSFILVITLIVCVLLFKKEKINLRNIILVLSSFTGFIIVYFFNYYKYSQFVNDEYQTAGRVKELELIISNFFGLIFSPSGGVLGYFWLSILIVISYFVFKNHYSKISLVFIISFLLNYLVLTFWFAPFGWVTYGPRLIMPTIVSLFLFIVIFYPKLNFKFNFLTRFLIVAGNLLSTFSVVGFLINSDAFKNWLENVIFNLPSCPKLYVWEVERTQYIKCFTSMTWENDSLPKLTLINYFSKLIDLSNFNLVTVLVIVLTFSLIARNMIYLFKNH